MFVEQARSFYDFHKKRQVESSGDPYWEVSIGASDLSDLGWLCTVLVVKAVGMARDESVAKYYIEPGVMNDALFSWLMSLDSSIRGSTADFLLRIPAGKRDIEVSGLKAFYLAHDLVMIMTKGVLYKRHPMGENPQKVRVRFKANQPAVLIQSDRRYYELDERANTRIEAAQKKLRELRPDLWVLHEFLDSIP